MEGSIKPQENNRKGLVFGLIIIGIGVVWLLRRMGVYLPGWLFDWPMILVVVGLIIGINNKFKSPVPYILIGIGGLGLIHEFFYISYEIQRYLWPMGLIAIGIIVIMRPKGRGKHKNSEQSGFGDPTSKVDSVSIFNGSKRYVTAKNFTGGETVSIFGGTEINLLNADFEGEVFLDNTVIFGGLKLIVPKNWEVNTNVTSIFGGVEDKRLSAVEVVSDEQKVLTITGTVIFGGIDIVSY